MDAFFYICPCEVSKIDEQEYHAVTSPTCQILIKCALMTDN